MYICIIITTHQASLKIACKKTVLNDCLDVLYINNLILNQGIEFEMSKSKT